MAFKRIVVLILSIVMIFCTGCWDKIEIDERAFVLAMAIDTPDNPKASSDDSELMDGMGKAVGEKNRIKTVFYIPVPSKLQGGDVDSFSVEESEGSNIPLAIENLNLKFSRQMFFGETKIILIGENALKNPVILKKLMDFVEREPDMGREAYVGVVKGETKKLTEVKPKFEKVFGVYMRGVFDNSGRMFSTLSLPINDFLSALRENKGTTVIPVVDVVDNKVAIKQLALLRDYKFLSYLDIKYLRPYSIITNKLEDGEIVVPYKEDSVSMKISSCDTKVNLERDEKNLRYKVNVRIEGDIDNYIMNEDIFKDKTINELKDEIQRTIKEELVKTTDYFQNDIGIDYLKLGEYTKKYHYKTYEKNVQNWDQEFRKAKIDYDVEVFIRRLGGTRN